MRQLDISFEIARRAAREGMDRAEQGAENKVPKWGELATEYLRRYAKTHEEFPGFFVTAEAERDPNFPSPENERAWGGVWCRAARAGIVRDSGRTMPHPKRHGCKAIVWVSLVYGR